MTRFHREDPDALDALAELARQSPKPPNQRDLERGLNRLRARVASPRNHRMWLPAVVVALCVALGASALLSRSLLTASAERITVSKIEGGKLLEGGYLSESGHDGVKLSLSEGSQFQLMPGARGRLKAVSAQGAQFANERGSASFRITPAPHRHWTVEAGPFVVAVTGTEFTVKWDPAEERLEVLLRRGRVLVSGPIVGEDLTLRPGQKLSVNLPRAETVISEARAESSADATSANTASATAAPVPPEPSALPAEVSSEPTPKRPPESSTPRTGRNWKQALANGQWDSILGDVEREGVEASVNSVSSDELFALTDAARYRRRPDIARAALLAQRRRFPGSPRSLDALFLLGRVEESRSGGATQALQWYDQYLDRAPSGTYAAEALGRKMVLYQKLRGSSAARAIAEQYLQRFPEGSYAGTARALSNAH